MQSVCQPSLMRTPECASALPLKGLQQISCVAGKSPQAALRNLLPVCNAIGDALAGKTAEIASTWPQSRSGYLAFDCSSRPRFFFSAARFFLMARVSSGDMRRKIRR